MVLADKIEKNIIFGANDEFVYFLASDYIEACFGGEDNMVYFNMHLIGSGNVSGQRIYYETANRCYWASYIRPIVELNSDVRVVEFKNNVWTLE